MATVPLPITEQSLDSAHKIHRAEAMRAFDEQHFGRHHARKSVTQLDEEIDKVSTSPLLKILNSFKLFWVVMSSIFLNQDRRVNKLLNNSC